MVVVRPEVASEHWHLSSDGRAAAEALAARDCWASVVRVYASPEPKATATAQRICARNALPLSLEAGLREVERPFVEGDYRAQAESYLRGEALPGWEPREAATVRIRDAIDAILKAHSEAEVAVVSHGLALSLFLARLLDLDGEATAGLWRGIAFPDHAIVDPGTRALVQPFSS